MKRVIAPRPVIRVALLPAQWSEQMYQDCLQKIVEAAKLIPALHVQNENDILVEFPSDCMLKGLGEEIVIEIRLPDGMQLDVTSENNFAWRVAAAVQDLLPEAHVQCSTSHFSTSRGFARAEPRT